MRRRTQNSWYCGTRTRSCVVSWPVGPLRARRPALVRCPVHADTSAPLARGLPGHPRHPACLAPQVHRREVGLHRAPTLRTPAHPSCDQDARCTAGPGELAMGAQADPGGVGPTRVSDRRVDGLEDPQHGRHRPGAASLRPHLARVPDRASRGHHGGRFFHIDTALGRRLYALAFLEHGTRRLHITGVTAHPTQDWAVQQARNLTADLGLRTDSLRFLLRDRDGKYGETFDAVFQSEEMEILKSAPRAPRMNAHCERIIGSIRREALDHVLIMNEAHARHVLAAYERHHNEHRPTRPVTSYHPTLTNSLSRCVTSIPAKSCAPGSSAASSTSTHVWRDVQRRLFERHRVRRTPTRTRSGRHEPTRTGSGAALSKPAMVAGSAGTRCAGERVRLR
ncbi:integrase core domain-containing protein [Saccharopolyspora erythraea]|uniref:integrase core domain-containing protein n=1 Tax=Saccharopolyspora erythraea TaxID=1836 RepID=UPI003D809501